MPRNLSATALLPRLPLAPDASLAASVARPAGAWCQHGSAIGYITKLCCLYCVVHDIEIQQSSKAAV